MQAEGSLLSLTNLRGLWSTWSELGGAARDEVNVVAVNVVGARRSCSGRSRRGRGRRGRSSAWLAQLLAPRLGVACVRLGRLS